MMEERCVCCGEPIPEGQQVCPKCKGAAEEDERFYIGYVKIAEVMHTNSGTFKEMIDWLDKEMSNPEATEGRVWREE